MSGTLLHVVTIAVHKKNYNKGREIVLTCGGIPWGHWCCLRLATNMFTREKIRSSPGFFPLSFPETNKYYWENPTGDEKQSKQWREREPAVNHKKKQEKA
jgi:hypothetical protein